MSVLLFGFSAGERPPLPPNCEGRDVIDADPFPVGVKQLLFVVHHRHAAKFVSWRGGAPALAVLWVPQSERELDDFWEDFEAIFHGGYSEDEKSFQRCMNCPQALVAGEAVQDIPAQWFVERSGPPNESDISKLPRSFRDQQASVLADPHGRAEVIERLRDRSSDVCRHFFPRPDAITAWLGGADSPEIPVMAMRSPFFRSLIREQTEILIDAKLLEPGEAKLRLEGIGVEPPRLINESGEPVLVDHFVWTTVLNDLGNAAASSARDLADQIAGFAEELVRHLVGEKGLTPMTGVRGSEKKTRSTPDDPAERAVERLRTQETLTLSTPNTDVHLRFSLEGEELQFRVLFSDNIVRPPRMRFLKSDAELFFVDPEPCAGGFLFRINAEILKRAEAAGAIQLEIYY
jgi:hypothetical protein